MPQRRIEAIARASTDIATCC